RRAVNALGLVPGIRVRPWIATIEPVGICRPRPDAWDRRGEDAVVSALHRHSPRLVSAVNFDINPRRVRSPDGEPDTIAIDMRAERRHPLTRHALPLPARSPARPAVYCRTASRSHPARPRTAPRS